MTIIIYFIELVLMKQGLTWAGYDWKLVFGIALVILIIQLAIEERNKT